MVIISFMVLQDFPWENLLPLQAASVSEWETWAM